MRKKYLRLLVLIGSGLGLYASPLKANYPDLNKDVPEFIESLSRAQFIPTLDRYKFKYGNYNWYIEDVPFKTLTNKRGKHSIINIKKLIFKKEERQDCKLRYFYEAQYTLAYDMQEVIHSLNFRISRNFKERIPLGEIKDQTPCGFFTNP